MNNPWTQIKGNHLNAQLIIRDMHSEIDLDGLKLLKLEIGQPGTRIMCTCGVLWLTQQGDPVDHLLKAGQSFILDRRGIVLVQGLPCGKALLPAVFQEELPSYSSLGRLSTPCAGAAK